MINFSKYFCFLKLFKKKKSQNLIKKEDYIIKYGPEGNRFIDNSLL